MSCWELLYVFINIQSLKLTIVGNKHRQGGQFFSFPLLSDIERVTAKAYGVLYDDPKDSASFRRAKRSWFVIDKEGIIRYAKTTEPGVFDKNVEVLRALSELK